MESTLASLIPTLGGPAIALIVVIYLYLKITSQRKATAIERDKDSQELHDKILKHDFEITNLKGDLSLQHNVNDDLNKQIVELSKAVAQFSVAVETLTQAVAELKQDIRDMRNK